MCNLAKSGFSSVTTNFIEKFKTLELVNFRAFSSTMRTTLFLKPKSIFLRSLQKAERHRRFLITWLMETLSTCITGLSGKSASLDRLTQKLEGLNVRRMREKWSSLSKNFLHFCQKHSIRIQLGFLSSIVNITLGEIDLNVFHCLSLCTLANGWTGMILLILSTTKQKDLSIE